MRAPAIAGSMLVLLACGDDSGPADVDGRVVDGEAVDGGARPDADGSAGPGPGNLLVTVVTAEGDPAPFTMVLTHALDGTLHGRQVTDEAGRADVEVPGSGGMVSAIHAGDGRSTMTTVVDVQPFDSVLFRAPPRQPAPTTVVSVGGPLVDGAVRYRALSSCGGSQVAAAPPVAIAPVAACLDGLARFALVAEGAGGAVLGQVDGVVDSAGAAVELAPPLRPLASLALDVRVPDGDVAVAPILPAGHEAMVPLPMAAPAGVVAVALVGAGTGLSLVVEGGPRMIAQRFATTPTGPVVMDLGAAPALTAPAHVDGALTWSAAGDGALDGFLIQIDAAPAAMTTWTLVVAPDARAVTLPILPADLAAASPYHGGDATAAIRGFDLSWVSDWRSFREGGHHDAAAVPPVVATKLEDARAVVTRSP